MATEIFANQPFTTVPAGAGADSGSEYWTVSSSTPFPTAQASVSQFHVTDTNPSASSEIILVTSVDAETNIWAVTRGAEGTTPVAHEAGFTITQVLTAGWLTGITSTSLPAASAGAVLYGDPSAGPAWLAGPTASTKEFLTSTGSGGTANTPAWGTIASTDVPVLNQNTTGTAATAGNVTGTVAVTNGGTGGTSATAYAVITGGTAATAPFQQIAGLGSSGQILTSNGAGSLPTWQPNVALVNPMTTHGDMLYESPGLAPASLAGNTSAAKNFLTSTGTGGTANSPAWGTIASADVPTLNQNTTGTSANVTGIVAVVNGGTGGTQATAYALLAGGTAATAPFQTVSGVGTSGQVLTSQGAGSLPTWSPATGFSNPMAVHGDMIFENAGLLPAALPGNTTGTRNFLTSTGSGGTANDPAWGTITSADIPVLNQNTTGTAGGLSTILAIGSGGTGQGSQQAALNALAGGTTPSGDYLRANGTNVTLSTLQAADLTGNVTISHGGTGAGNQQAAINALTGTQGAGEYLRSDGTNASLQALQAGDLTGTVAVTHGGTGGTSATAYAVVTGGTSATTPFQQVASLGTAGQALLSNGAGSLPSWQTTVNTVTAADSSIVIGGTASAPTVAGQLSRPQTAKYSVVSGQTPRESVPFYTVTGSITAVPGYMFLSVLPVSPGDVISNVGFITGAVAATFGTTASTQHWWTALYDDGAQNLLRQSADQGTAPLTANTAQMLALSSSYTVPASVYVLTAGVMVNVGTGGASTSPTFRGPFLTTPLFDSTSSLFPTSRMYAATTGAGTLGAVAPPGPLSLTPFNGAVYFGAD